MKWLSIIVSIALLVALPVHANTEATEDIVTIVCVDEKVAQSLVDALSGEDGETVLWIYLLTGMCAVKPTPETEGVRI